MRLSTHPGILIAIAAVMVALCRPLGAQEPATARQYPIPGHGSLLLRVPQDWKGVGKSLEKPPSFLFRFAPPSGDAFLLQVTSVWLEPEKSAALIPDTIKSGIQATAVSMLPEAIEKEAAVVELRGPQSIGYHFTLTRRSPPAGEKDYKYVTQGTFKTGEVVTIFTLLYRDSGLAEKERALRMLAEASHSPTGPAAPPAPAYAEILQVRESEKGYELSVPASPLVMTIPKGGLARARNPQGGAASSPRYFYFEDPANHLFVSGWIEAARRFPGIKPFWENETAARRRRGLRDPQDVVFTKIENWDAIVYDETIAIGTNSHIRAHWLQAGTWIDMHVSIAAESSSAEARARLTALLKTIQVKERE